MIQIKSGTCGTSQGYKTRADGELSLPISEEARLVARGAAEYVMRPIKGNLTGVATTAGGGSDNTPSGNEGEDGCPAEGAEESFTDLIDTLDIVDGHFTKESLMKMGRKEMEDLAEGLEVDVSKCRNKGEIADLLAAVELQVEEDGGIPPDLTTEEPM